MWGQPEEGNASDKTLKTTLVSASAPLLARDGVQPGASIYMAEAALVTEDHRAPLRHPVLITRLPAPSSACGRVMAAAVAHTNWEEVGVLAQTPPTKRRPGTFEKVAERRVTLAGQVYRAVVVPSSTQAQRRQPSLARDRQASSATREAAVREATQQESCGQAAAEAAAAKRRARQRTSPGVAVLVEERPTDGPGRPS